MPPYLFFILIVLAQTACSQNFSAISGNINMHEGWHPVVYVVQPRHYREVASSYEGMVVDSAVISADGSFSFLKTTWLKESGLYFLFVQPFGRKYKNGIAFPLPKENYIPLVLSPQQPTRLSGDIAALTRTYKIEVGTPDTRQLEALSNLREQLYQAFEKENQQNSEEHIYFTYPGGEDAAGYYEALDKYLDTTTALLPAFVAFRWREPNNEFRNAPERHIEAYRRLKMAYSSHPWLDEMLFYLHPDKLPVLEGERMPDFALPTPNGDTLRQSDIKAKLLLVDFWASWCAPCRREAKEVIGPLYDQYHEKGFEVLGISIDNDRNSWVNAIKKDNARWLHASDLLGDASPVRQSLKFETIPANYLLDENGRLLARNLHGEELKNFVEEYFKQ